MFTLTIKTGNAALQTDDGDIDDLALSDLIANVARRVSQGAYRGDVRDTNGNKVGSFNIEE